MARPGQRGAVFAAALEDEQQLDLTAAEADWKKYTDVGDKGAARLALADSITGACAAPTNSTRSSPRRSGRPLLRKVFSASRANSWKTFQRSINWWTEAGSIRCCGSASIASGSRGTLRRHDLYRGFFAFAMAHERYEVAGNLIEGIKKPYPSEKNIPIEATAELVAKTGSPARALEVYDRELQAPVAGRADEEVFRSAEAIQLAARVS